MIDRIEPKAGPHRDYQENLKYAEQISAKENTGKINGLRVKVSDSEHLKKALLIISWCPGTTVKRGNYATPIFLHQYAEDFRRTTHNVLNFYKKTIEDHEKSNPVQLDLLDTSLKV
jgi:hypothetical protein